MGGEGKILFFSEFIIRFDEIGFLYRTWLSSICLRLFLFASFFLWWGSGDGNTTVDDLLNCDWKIIKCRFNGNLQRCVAYFSFDDL